MIEFLLLVPPTAMAMLDSGGRWGELSAQLSMPERLARVNAMSTETAPRFPLEGLNRTHFLNYADTKPVGRWFRVDADPQLHWYAVRIRQSGLTLAGFRGMLPAKLPDDPGSSMYFALTYAPDLAPELTAVGVPRLAGWAVTSDGVCPVPVAVDQTDLGLNQLEGLWPVEVVQAKRVCIVGAGSIGSAASHALALYGVGSLDLVDPDRLLAHNLIRHTSSAKYVGMLKVNALKRELEELRGHTRVNAHVLDVVNDANAIRELLGDVDLLLCATDGVASRRVAGHLARRASKDAILACVLEGGALGEVIRLRPWPGHACIGCSREHLQEVGAFDPEPSVNRPYGEGTHHQPMTAVGADLHLVGQLAAKMAVATLLQADGCNGQRLQDDHLLIGLRPSPAWPPPYDVRRCGEIKWLPAAPARPGCPTCDTPP